MDTPVRLARPAVEWRDLAAVGPLEAVRELLRRAPPLPRRLRELARRLDLVAPEYATLQVF